MAGPGALTNPPDEMPVPTDPPNGSGLRSHKIKPRRRIVYGVF